MTVEWARSAWSLYSSTGNTASCRGLICQLGLLVHAADVSRSEMAAKSIGRWVAIIKASSPSGTSAARRARNLSDRTREYAPLVPSGRVYLVTLTDEAKSKPGNRSRQSLRHSPTAGRGAAAYTRLWPLGSPPAWVMTAPP